MICFIEDTEAGKSLALKMAEQYKPGAIMLLTNEEMEASMGMRVISDKLASDVEVIEIDPDKNYIAVVKDGEVNLDDIMGINKWYNKEGFIFIIREYND